MQNNVPNFIKILFVLAGISVYPFFIYGGEGIWLPILLQSLNEKDMKSQGMKMSAKDIYNVNKGSLKDAIVQFGGGCTGEIISDKGLLLTNHHCGYGYITSHSTIEHNYLKNGFWATKQNQELACPGLTAMFIVRMEDVTAMMTNGLDPKLNDWERRPILEENTKKVLASIQHESYEEVMVRAFYNGNQFYAFVTQTFKDVRLVGTPPESIGKFGSDTDNWVWPRHTGDFSIFRVYADKENHPAAFAADNKPFKPKHFLPISIKGIKEGDFTMVFGFPGRTNEYLNEEGVRQIVEVQNPIRITCRDFVLKTMDKYIRKDEKTKIQYAPTYASIANSWKKWIGESQGVKKTNGLERKHKQDIEFQNRVNKNSKFESYRMILPELDKNYKALETYAQAKEYYGECFQRNVNVAQIYNGVKNLINLYEGRGAQSFEDRKKEYAQNAKGLFESFNINIEKEIFKGLTDLFMEGINPALTFPYFRTKMNEHNNDVLAFTNQLYNNSKLTNLSDYSNLMSMSYDSIKKVLKTDPVWQFYEEMNFFIAEDVNKTATAYEDNISVLRRSHMAALMQVFPERKFYPDANSTLRVTYGKVEGFSPKDGLCYKTQTYLDGVLDKYIPGDYEFDVPAKLIDLYNKKDYGMYAENGKLPLAFIASNHTTGGNSGSPAIDANGNLIGLNFDRVWEGTMSDINYDVNLCRNIMVDTRYILFIIDKFAGAGDLIKEMKIIKP